MRDRVGLRRDRSARCVILQTRGGVVVGALWLAVLWLALAATAAAAGGEQEDVVTDYEVRLEEIAGEITDIRRELDALVEELVEPEVARVFIFLGAAPRRVRQGGVALRVDGKTVFSRPFSPAEQDVLQRGLPLELVELQLPEGEHQVTLSALGAEALSPHAFRVERGGIASWIGQISESGVEWLAE